MTKTKAEDKRPRSRSRRIIGLAIKIPMFVLLGVFLLLAILQFVLSTPAIMGKVLDFALPKVGGLIGAEIRVGSFSLSLVPLHLEIEDAVFTRQNDTFRMPFAGAKRIEANLDLVRLIGGRIVIDDLEIWGGWNYLYIDDGLENLPEFPKSDKPEKKKEKESHAIRFPLQLKKGTIHDTHFAMDMPGIDMVIEVPAINGDIFCDMWDEQEAGADLVVESTDFRLGKIDQHVRRVEVDGGFSFRDMAAFADRLLVEAQEAAMSGEGHIWDLVGGDGVAMDFTAEIDAEMSAVNRLFVQEPALDGTVHASVRLGANLPKFNLEGTVSMDRGRVNDLALRDLDAAFHLNLERVILERMTAAAAGGSLRADGTIRFKDGLGIDATAHLDRIDIARAMNGYGIKGAGVAGVATGKADVAYTHGDPGVWTADAEVDVEKLRYGTPGETPVVQDVAAAVEAKLRMVGRTIGLDRARIRAPHTLVEAEGVFDLDGDIDGNFRLASLNLEDFSPLLGRTFSGQMRLEGLVAGRIDEPSIEADLAAADLRWGGYGPDLIEADARFKGTDLSLSKLEVRRDETVLEGSGTIGLSDGPRFDLQLGVADGRVEDVLAMAGRNLDVSGRLDLALRTWGPLKELNGVGTVTLGRTNLFGEELTGIELDLNAQDGVVRIAKGVLEKEGGSLHVSGSVVPFDGTMDVELTSRDLTLRDFYYVRKIDIPIYGQLEIAAEAKGSFFDPDAWVRIELKEPTLNDNPIGGGYLSAELTGGDLSAEIDLLGHQVLGRGTADLSESSFDARLGMSRLDLSIAGAFSGALKELKGALTADAAVKGRYDDFDSLQMDASVDDLRIAYGDVKFRNPDPVAVGLDDGLWSVENGRLAGEGFELIVTTAQQGSENRILVDLESDLAVVRAVSGAIAEADGTIQARIELYGAVTDPQMKGELTVRDGALDVINAPQPLRDIQLDVDITTDAYTVRTFSLKTGGGTLTGGGVVKLENLFPSQYELFVKGDQIRTGYAPYLDAEIESLDLILTGQDGLFELSGDVRLDEAVYTRNLDWRTILEAFQSETTAAELFKEPGEKFMDFNIAIHADDGLRFNNNLADIEMAAELIFTGNDQQPGLLGDVTVIEGDANVLKGKYDLTNGLIQFYDDTRIFPVIDITAETTVNETFIVVFVSGTPDDLNITFSSDPPKSDQDIIALLTLGVDYEEFQEKVAGGGDQDQTAEGTAIQAAASVLGGQLSAVADRYAGLQIGVDTSTGVTRLKVSREIQKDLYFNYFWEILGTGVMAQLEYNFFRFMALVGTWQNAGSFSEQSAVDPWGAFGGAIRFKIDFQ